MAGNNSAPKVFLLLFTIILFLSGCTFEEPKAGFIGDVNAMKFGKVDFKTQDGFTIKGNMLRGGKEAVLMLHQFALEKSTYDGLARKLADKNFTALAIDLCGHGESLEQNGVRRSFADFSDGDFRDMQKDVAAAKKFLEREGFTLKAIVGSSIGANTALNYAAADPSVEKIVLLSPGLDYKGIEIGKSAKNVRSQALIVADPADSYSYASSKSLLSSIQGSKFVEMRDAG